MPQDVNTPEVKKARKAFLAVVGPLVVIILAAVVAGVVAYITDYRYNMPTAEDRIADLGRIQRSLKDVDSYVETQRLNLASNSSELRKLEAQTRQTQEALSVSRPQLDALLAAAGLRPHPWYEQMFWWFVSVAVALVVGFLSSVAANRYSVFRKVKNESVSVGGGLEMKGSVGTVVTDRR